MWYFNKAPLLYLLKKLRKIQHRAALSILGAFCTFPTLGIKAIAGLIPTHLHLQKLSGRQQLRTATLLSNHTIKFLLENRHTNEICLYHLSLKNMTSKQYFKIKSSIINEDNCFNGIFSLFDTLNSNFSPRSGLINSFSNCFSFH